MNKLLVALLIVSITTPNLHSDSTLVVSSNHHTAPLLVAGALTTAFVAGGCCAWKIASRKTRRVQEGLDRALLANERLTTENTSLNQNLLNPLAQFLHLESTSPTVDSTFCERIFKVTHKYLFGVKGLKTSHAAEVASLEAESAFLTKKLKQLLKMITTFLHLEFSFANLQEVDLEPLGQALDEKTTQNLALIGVFRKFSHSELNPPFDYPKLLNTLLKQRSKAHASELHRLLKKAHADRTSEFLELQNKLSDRTSKVLELENKLKALTPQVSKFPDVE